MSRESLPSSSLTLMRKRKWYWLLSLIDEMHSILSRSLTEKLIRSATSSLALGPTLFCFFFHKSRLVGSERNTELRIFRFEFETEKNPRVPLARYLFGGLKSFYGTEFTTILIVRGSTLRDSSSIMFAAFRRSKCTVLSMAAKAEQWVTANALIAHSANVEANFNGKRQRRQGKKTR